LVVATGPAASADKADLAHGRPVVTSSNQATATAITDGNQDTYWASATSHDQWAQVDLGKAARLDRAGLRLPAGWDERTQQLSVQTSVDGGAFETAAAAGPKSFRPKDDNTVTIRLGEVHARFVRVAFASQGTLASVEVYAAAESTTNLVAAVS